MKKKLFIWTGTAVVIIAAAVIFFGMRGTVKRTFQYVKIEKGDIESTVSCTGTLQFYNTENVIPKVAGIVNGLYADFNSKVKKGQLLAKIDDSSFKIDLQTALANLAKAQAGYAQSLTDFSNTLEMFNQQFKAQSDLDTAKLNLVTALNAVQIGQTALDSARLNIRYSSIISPLTGIVVQRNINLGDAVSANNTASPAFIVASDISLMQTLASVDESDISQIKTGQKVHFTVQAYNDMVFSGVVYQIRLQPAVVQNVVNYTVVVNVNNKDGRLLPGMTATMDLVTSSITNVFKVPNSALKFRPPADLLKELRQGFTNAGRGGYSSRNTNRQGSGNSNANGGYGGKGQAGNGSSTTNRQDMTVLWTVDDKSGKIRPVRVKIGFSDGQMTQISSTNIMEGMQVVSGIVTGNTAAASQSRSPFQPQGPGGGFGGGRGHYKNENKEG
jgi:HlyD family secretion protein